MLMRCGCTRFAMPDASYTTKTASARMRQRVKVLSRCRRRRQQLEDAHAGLTVASTLSSRDLALGSKRVNQVREKCKSSLK